jgi:cytochrome c
LKRARGAIGPGGFSGLEDFAELQKNEPKILKYCSCAQKRAPIRRPPQLLSHEPARWPASSAGRLGNSQIREDNVKLLSFSIAGAALIASIGAAAAQDAAAGEKVFPKCKICHQIGEGAKNMVGPVLNGVVGRPAGTYAGYHYSDANKNSGITWDEATLKEYLKDPKAKVPGTKMVFPGLKSDEDIANLIAYLKQFGPDGKKI